MALHNLKLRQKGRKMSAIAFDELIRAIGGNNQINLATVRVVKKIDCLKHHFRASDDALRDSHDKRVLSNLVASIKQDNPFDLDIPALTYNPSSQKHEVIYKIEEYLDKKTVQSIRMAVKYSEHKPNLQKQLDKVLSEMEKELK